MFWLSRQGRQQRLRPGRSQCRDRLPADPHLHGAEQTRLDNGIEQAALGILHGSSLALAVRYCGPSPSVRPMGGSQ